MLRNIHKPWIKLKETIDQKDYELINKLQAICIQYDQTALKLELDYKLGADLENNGNSSVQNVNEFMYFNGEEIIGYIGIGSFGGGPIEVNGMVHPEYRRKGVFKTLSQLVISEWKRRNLDSMLLLCDRKSSSGQEFIKKTGAHYKFSEYEMFLEENNLKSLQRQECGIVLRKATNEDAYEIARQNKIYFNKEFENNENDLKNNDLDIIPIEEQVSMLNKGIILPEEEEKKGMIIYLAEKDEKIIGKVNLQLISKIGGIYGLGVLPEYRGKGFGRQILTMAIEKLKEQNPMKIMLQVAAENLNALNLYRSCGFKETSTMDYYEMRR